MAVHRLELGSNPALLSISELVSTTWASASNFRGSDKRGRGGPEQIVARWNSLEHIRFNRRRIAIGVNSR
ncbi:MAG: hypothetical protein HQL67_06620 [Magnetococcales bacterium]|nr:hypothetical protein [Magnetococcales bacterium]